MTDAHIAITNGKREDEGKQHAFWRCASQFRRWLNNF
jgi:hypothetical protein